jgi:single-strand DNA-binding protein
MARGINKVILIGNLGNDPDIRYLPNGNPVATLSIATGESWKDKTTGKTEERTEWHRVVCFNRLAEIIGEYTKKGSKIYIEGSLRTRKWQDKQGQDRYTTEVVAQEMQLLDAKSSSQSGGYPDEEPRNYGQSKSSSSMNNPSSSAEPFPGMDDDIPF